MHEANRPWRLAHSLATNLSVVSRVSGEPPLATSAQVPQLERRMEASRHNGGKPAVVDVSVNVLKAAGESRHRNHIGHTFHILSQGVNL